MAFKKVLPSILEFPNFFSAHESQELARNCVILIDYTKRGHCRSESCPNANHSSHQVTRARH